jgi:hypothetical protein
LIAQNSPKKSGDKRPLSDILEQFNGSGNGIPQKKSRID